MTERLLIYHGDCFDGWTAAYIVKRHYWKDAQLFGAKYGEGPPPVAGKEVLVIDFSYPREQLLEMHRQAAFMRVLDHHKTAWADLDGLSFCTFDMERSGAGLAWDELVGSRDHAPDLVSIIEDRDLWRFKLPYTQHAMAYIACKPHTLEAWDELWHMTGEEMSERGSSVQEYVDRFGVLARREATREWIGGVEMPCINTPYMNCSDHVNGLLGPDAPIAAGYFRRRDGRWQFSLRSVQGVDCSPIAIAFGGGGHAQAAGFSVVTLPWESK